MDAGEELNRLVAVHVMGLKDGEDFGVRPYHGPWKIGEDFGNRYCDRCLAADESEPCEDEPPDYSGFLSSAWDVLTTMRDRFGCVVINEFSDSHGVQIMRATGEPIASAFGDTIPHAICLAALAAVGHPVRS